VCVRTVVPPPILLVDRGEQRCSSTLCGLKGRGAAQRGAAYIVSMWLDGVRVCVYVWVGGGRCTQ
jgi:hypothetical protein